MRRCLALLLTILNPFAVVPLAQAQSVRRMPSAPSVRADYRQAQRENRSWPDLAGGEDGTVVRFTGDGNNADMTVTSSASEEKVLDAVRSAALAVDLPKTDYLKRHGTLTASVDAEFNDYLVRHGRLTRFDFPVGRLLLSLRQAGLPNPIVAVVEREGRRATLVGPKGRRELSEDTTLFDFGELAGYDRLEIEFHLEWWAPLAAGGLLTGFAFMFGYVVYLPYSVIFGKKKTPAESSSPLTPEQVQARYDAQAALPRWRSSAQQGQWIFPPLFLTMVLLSNRTISRQAASAMPRWIEPATIWWILPVLVVAILVPLLVGLVRTRRKAKREGSIPNLTKGMAPMFFGLAYMFGLVVVSRLRPDLMAAIPASYRMPIIVTFPVLMGGLSLYLMLRPSLRGKRERRVLPPDDSISIATHELAEQAGVRVRTVVEVDSAVSNAFATPLGTVGVTRGLRTTLNEEETRAVLAHEIGHLKASDPLRFLVASLGILLVAYGVWFVLITYTRAGNDPTARITLQMLFYFGPGALITRLIAPRRRRAEHAADLFALRQTGDVELVARALVKIHDANFVPHRLHPRDERDASHPALVKRLERLREAAREPEGL